MSRFMLECPPLCRILFCVRKLCTSCVVKTFLLASSSVITKQLLCFVHGQGQKKRTNKVFFPLVLTWTGFVNPKGQKWFSRQAVGIVRMSYIGKRKRCLHDRKTEHFKALSHSYNGHSSAIADHTI